MIPSPETLAASHPAAYYQLAAHLFQAGQRDEAVFWFYLGQLRYRFHLAAAQHLDPSGDPALFAALSESVGRPLNEYAFADIPTLAATLDRVLAWDFAHPNTFTPKESHQQTLAQIRTGLQELRDTILKDQATIRASRRANGLDAP
jgi:hypothetical protein